MRCRSTRVEPRDASPHLILGLIGSGRFPACARAAEKLQLDTSERAEFRHTVVLKSHTHLAPESHDEAVSFRENRDAWIPGGCDPVCLPARANIGTARDSAAVGQAGVAV